MSIQVFEHVKDAIRNLDPEDIRKHTERPLRLLLYADSDQQYREMEDYLVPRDLSAAKRAEVRRLTYRGSEGVGPRAKGDLEIYFDPARELDSGESDVFGFDPGRPDAMVHQILHRRLTGHCVLPRGLGASGSLNVILPTLLAGAEFCGPAQSYRSRDNPNLKHRFDSSLALVHLFEKPGPRLSSLWARWRADNLSA